jgi:LPS-assembly protein
MKNKFKIILYFTLCFNIVFFTYVKSNEQFNFDVTEIEITNEGNYYKGLKRGIASTNDGNTIIKADTFDYNKITNILKASGNVIVDDSKKGIIITSKNITYFKNNEKIFTEGNSKATYDGTKIIANKFDYDIKKNVLIANENVKVDDTIKNNIVYAEKITYLKNEEKILTTGTTEGILNLKYKFNSQNIIIYRNKNLVKSSYFTSITDNNSTKYNLDNFVYNTEDEVLKAKGVEIITNYLKLKSDKFNFSSGFFNLKTYEFLGEETAVTVHKDIFDVLENDPRIVGTSSSGNKDEIVVNKGIFTSCKKNENCPAWSIKAKRIKHDKKSKQLIYDQAFLNLYDIPVLYFPKFFHPDPTVKRQSGFLQPQINQSDLLGSSLHTPYFYAISDNRDLTIKPVLFDSNILMLQNEYRQVNKNSTFVADFNLINGYKPKGATKKKSVSHLFAKYNLSLGLDNFNKSNIDITLEKVTNDGYLSVFDNNLIDMALKPINNSELKSSIKLTLDNDQYNFNSGLEVYETLSGTNSDRYQYVFPYYNFSRNLFSNSIGTLGFQSTGSNNLNNTNNLKTEVLNDLNFNSIDYFSEIGFKNNFGIYLKNLNSVAKNDNLYKSSPQSEIMNLFEINSSLPMIKNDMENQTFSSITPKFSLRFSPNDMKDFNNVERIIDANNIFNINRLGLSNSFETGKSLSLGMNYKKEYLDNINKHFELDLASVFRDKEENKIPNKSTLNKKTSNIFGGIKQSFSENFEISYDFSLDNNLKNLERNKINTKLSVNNFVTEFNFIETNGDLGESNSFESSISYQFDKFNYLSFNTRRNREINFTEYYDLLYEYKNDCLTAGIKYKKTYYTDNDLQPKEDLLLTFTFYPLTTYEQKIDQQLYRD